MSIKDRISFWENQASVSKSDNTPKPKAPSNLASTIKITSDSNTATNTPSPTISQPPTTSPPVVFKKIVSQQFTTENQPQEQKKTISHQSQPVAKKAQISQSKNIAHENTQPSVTKSSIQSMKKQWQAAGAVRMFSVPSQPQPRKVPQQGQVTHSTYSGQVEIETFVPVGNVKERAQRLQMDLMNQQKKRQEEAMLLQAKQQAQNEAQKIGQASNQQTFKHEQESTTEIQQGQGVSQREKKEEEVSGSGISEGNEVMGQVGVRRANKKKMEHRSFDSDQDDE